MGIVKGSLGSHLYLEMRGFPTQNRNTASKLSHLNDVQRHPKEVGPTIEARVDDRDEVSDHSTQGKKHNVTFGLSILGEKVKLNQYSTTHCDEKVEDTHEETPASQDKFKVHFSLEEMINAVCLRVEASQQQGGTGGGRHNHRSDTQEVAKQGTGMKEA